jgi:hypothetical protein
VESDILIIITLNVFDIIYLLSLVCTYLDKNCKHPNGNKLDMNKHYIMTTHNHTQMLFFCWIIESSQQRTYAFLGLELGLGLGLGLELGLGVVLGLELGLELDYVILSLGTPSNRYKRLYYTTPNMV